MTWSALVVDDDPGIRQSIRLCLEVQGARALGVGTAAAALEALDRARFDVVFLDLWLGPDSGLTLLPDILRRQQGVGVIVITAYATIETAVEAMRLGATDYLPKPFSPDQVRLTAGRVLAANQLTRQVAELRSRVAENEGRDFFETRSQAFRAFLETAGRVAPTDCVVLLQGPSGTGKNVLARWIRARSTRAEQPFVTVHCPMLTAELMSSALFGHRRGAFTGAVNDTVGRVEEAEHGTLFLDEVSDLTPDAQSRLLRFLNDRTYERLGDTKERKADVRIIAATNRPLDEEVRTGRFRQDLFFRLNVVSLTLPALRERPEDIVPLAEHYLVFLAARRCRADLRFSDSCLKAIEAFGWPGNLRQLRNAVERGVILSPSSILEPADLGLALEATEESQLGQAPGQASYPAALGGDCSLDELEREHIARLVARTPSLEAAARLLKIDATTLQRKRKRYGLV